MPFSSSGDLRNPLLLCSESHGTSCSPAPATPAATPSSDAYRSGGSTKSPQRHETRRPARRSAQWSGVCPAASVFGWGGGSSLSVGTRGVNDLSTWPIKIHNEPMDMCHLLGSHCTKYSFKVHTVVPFNFLRSGQSSHWSLSPRKLRRTRSTNWTNIGICLTFYLKKLALRLLSESPPMGVQTCPRDPSTFSGDWRQSYVGLEGPVVPSEKVGWILRDVPVQYAPVAIPKRKHIACSARS